MSSSSPTRLTREETAAEAARPPQAFMSHSLGWCAWILYVSTGSTVGLLSRWTTLS